MPGYLITYDIKETKPDPHPSVLTHAEKNDLLYLRLTKKNNIYRLPDTTLWGVFANAKAARKAFDSAVAAAAKALGTTVVVEKLYLTMIGDTDHESDKKKPAEKKWTGKTVFETCRLHQLNDKFF